MKNIFLKTKAKVIPVVLYGDAGKIYRDAFLFDRNSQPFTSVAWNTDKEERNILRF